MAGYPTGAQKELLRLSNAIVTYLINVVSFEVDAKGNIKNPFKRKWHLWQDLVQECKKRGKPKSSMSPRFIGQNQTEMHNVLSNKSKREEHIRQVLEAVLKNNFDGININYERVWE